MPDLEVNGVPMGLVTDAVPEMVSVWDATASLVGGPNAPGPGDPDTPWVPAEPRRLGRRVDLLLKRPGADRFGPLRTFLCDSWTDPLSWQEPGTIEGTASLYDPAWAAIIEGGVTIGGTVAGRVDPRRLDAELCVDGQPVAVGTMVEHPVAVDGDFMRLRFENPVGMLSALSLRGGDTPEDTDELGGAGSFDGANPLTGWAGPIVLSSSDPFSGTRCLGVTGSGTVTGPWVSIPGSTDTRAGWIVACVVRLAGDEDSSGAQLVCQIQRWTGSTWADVGSEGEPAAADQTIPGEWQPLAARQFTSILGGSHRMRMVLNVLSADPIHVDEVRYRQDSFVGAALPEDLIQIGGRVLTASVFRYAGHGLGWAPGPPVGGAGITQTWFDSTNTSAASAMSALTDRPDGFDLWCDETWTFRAWPRRGTDRGDIASTDATVIDANWVADGAMVVDELTTHTGVGSGVGELILRSASPVTAGTRRSEATNRFVDAEYAQTAKWHDAHFTHGAGAHVAGSSLFRWDYGSTIGTGDGLWVAHRRGVHGVAGWMRVGNRRFRPQAETVEVEWGPDPVVDGLHSWV